MIPVHAVSLGCPKNRADTEKFLKRLDLPIRLDAEAAESRLVLLNTCAFIEPASRESIRTLLLLIDSLGDTPARPILVAMGCLPARYGIEELKKEFPEVDYWLASPDDERTIQAISQRIKTLSDGFKHPINFGRRSYAYIKIADGCDHGCSFCAIPHFKGKYVSTPLTTILEDAREALEEGVAELILVAQDLLSWGRDLNGSPTFMHLLEKMLSLKGMDWLRLLYLYPSLITDDLLKFMAQTGLPLLPYFDVPFQHSQTEILRKMGRPFKKDPRRVIERIRAILPEAAIRTTIITGFPGESERDFLDLCHFVEESGFAHLGVFPYHAEEGTKAAEMSGQLPMEIREERRKIIMELQAPISEAWLESFLGKKMRVMVDESDFQEWPGLYKGRVWFQAPEIDGVTYISGDRLEIGHLEEAEISDSSTYDLSALAIGRINN